MWSSRFWGKAVWGVLFSKGSLATDAEEKEPKPRPSGRRLNAVNHVGYNTIRTVTDVALREIKRRTVPGVCKELAAPSCFLRVSGKTHKRQMKHEWFKYEDLFLKETQGPRMPKFCQGKHDENVRETTRQPPKPEKQP